MASWRSPRSQKKSEVASAVATRRASSATLERVRKSTGAPPPTPDASRRDAASFCRCSCTAARSTRRALRASCCRRRATAAAAVSAAAASVSGAVSAADASAAADDAAAVSDDAAAAADAASDAVAGAAAASRQLPERTSKSWAADAEGATVVAA